MPASIETLEKLSPATNLEVERTEFQQERLAERQQQAALGLSQTAFNGIAASASAFYGAEHGMVTSYHAPPDFPAPVRRYQSVMKAEDADVTSASQELGTGYSPEAALAETLVGMRTLETVKTRPIVRMTISETTSVDLTALQNYAPKMAPGIETYAKPSYVKELLKEDNKDAQSTYFNTIKEPGWEDQLTGMVEGYLTDSEHGQQLKQDLKLKSLQHLTPEQAVKLSIAFVQGVSKYNWNDVESANGNSESDKKSAMELLQEGIQSKDDPAWSGNGICRNVASNVRAVFEALKGRQAELSMLNNTYAVFTGGYDGQGYDDRRQTTEATANAGSKTIRTGHAWNTFVTVGAEGSAAVTTVDATWALEKDPASAMEHMDYTAARSAATAKELLLMSTDKMEAIADYSHYVEKYLFDTRADLTKNQQAKQQAREFITTEYLSAMQTATRLFKVKAEDMPLVPEEVTSIAYQMKDRLVVSEISTLIKLHEQNVTVNRDVTKNIVSEFAKARAANIERGEDDRIDDLVIHSDEFQKTAFAAIGAEQAAKLSEKSPSLRVRLRELQPQSLPTFNAHDSPADAAELTELARRVGVTAKEPDEIVSALRKKVVYLVGDTPACGMVLTAVSDYELAKNFKTIVKSLKPDKK